MGSIEKIGVVIFDGIERLDYEGPEGVFGWAAIHSGRPISVTHISKNGHPVTDHLSGVTIKADAGLDEADGFDLLLVPGGDIGQFADDDDLIAGVLRLGVESRIVASVCTGAFLVAAAGLADGKSIATHWLVHRQFESSFPNAWLAKDKRFVRDGKLWSSAGISAGIDMSLNLVAAEYGSAISKKCQGFPEYFPEPPWTRAEVAEALQT